VKPDGIGLLLAASLVAATLSTPATAQTSAEPSATAPAPTIDRATRKAVIEGAIARIEASYVFPDKAPAIAKALRRQLKAGGFDTLDDPNAFVDAVNAVIAREANDKHLRLIWSREPLPPPPGAGGEPDAATIARQQAMMQRRNYAMPKAEVLDGNIGYLKMTSSPGRNTPERPWSRRWPSFNIRTP
jgi:hypothetical protein